MLNTITIYKRIKMKYIILGLKITLFTLVSISIIYLSLSIEHDTQKKMIEDSKVANSISSMANQAKINKLTK